MSVRPSRLLAGTLLAVLLGACSVSVSTAHIGSLAIGATKDFTSETTTFGPRDTVYAQASADNLPNSVTMNWQVLTVAVAGQASNAPIAALNQSMQMASDGTSSATYSPPTAGWPAGTYKIVVTMVDGGTQRDQKSENFTVSGSGGSSPAPASAAPASAAPSSAPSSAPSAAPPAAPSSPPAS